MTFQGVSKVPSGTFIFRGTSRVGIAVGGGVFLPLGSGLVLDAGMRYSMMNLGGGSWSDPDLFNDARVDSYIALNDTADPVYLPNDDEHFIGAGRAIHTLQLTLTILIEL